MAAAERWEVGRRRQEWTTASGETGRGVWRRACVDDEPVSDCRALWREGILPFVPLLRQRAVWPLPPSSPDNPSCLPSVSYIARRPLSRSGGIEPACLPTMTPLPVADGHDLDAEFSFSRQEWDVYLSCRQARID